MCSPENAVAAYILLFAKLQRLRFKRNDTIMGETNLSGPGILLDPGLGGGLTDLDGNVLELYGGKDSCGTGLWGAAVKRRRRKLKTYVCETFLNEVE